MHATVQRCFHWSWRRAIVAAILGLWLVVGLAWGAGAALVFAFPLFVGCVYGVWVALAGRLLQEAGGGYYHRQLDPHRSGNRRHQ
jgi:hypothetical protein